MLTRFETSITDVCPVTGIETEKFVDVYVDPYSDDGDFWPKVTSGGVDISHDLTADQRQAVSCEIVVRLYSVTETVRKIIEKMRGQK